jgi:hypothetical protein
VLISKAQSAIFAAAALEILLFGKNLFHFAAIGPSMNQAFTAAFTEAANQSDELTSENHADSTSEVETHAAATKVLTNSALFIVAAGLKEDLDQSNTFASDNAVT